MELDAVAVLEVAGTPDMFPVTCDFSQKLSNKIQDFAYSLLSVYFIKILILNRFVVTGQNCVRLRYRR